MNGWTDGRTDGRMNGPTIDRTDRRIGPGTDSGWRGFGAPGGVENKRSRTGFYTETRENLASRPMPITVSR